MKIDVIIPVLNLEKYIKQAIESVLVQKFIHKVHIVDAGCKDQTISIVEGINSSQIDIIRDNGKLNASQARNVGILASKASHISFLDGDDFWLSDKIEEQLSYLKENPDNISFSKVEQFHSEDLSEIDIKKIKIHSKLSSAPHVGTMICSRKTFDTVGLFDESLNYGEFIDWFIKAKNKKIGYNVINKVFMKRRIHETNTGRIRKKDRIDLIKILKRSISEKNGKI